MSKLKPYLGEELEPNQEVCPFCKSICEPGASLYCSHYLASKIDGDLCWYATEHEKQFLEGDDFFTHLADLYMFTKVSSIELAQLISDSKFIDLIKTVEEVEFSLERFVTMDHTSNAKYKNSGNLFHGIYAENVTFLQEMIKTIQKHRNIFYAVFTLSNADYSISKN